MIKETIFGYKAPRAACQDKKCPFHAAINVRKEFFTGKVVRKDLNRSATIQWSDPYYVPKYERYEIRRRHARVHNPSCIDAQIGDDVVAARCRPLSKTKNHIIIATVNAEKKEISSADEKAEAKKGAAIRSKKNQPNKELLPL